MELEELNKSYGTEQQCREYIAKIRWKYGYHCPRCQSMNAWKTSEQKYKCQSCGHKVSVTSKTVFQDSHIPLPIWFKALWYISAQNRNVTALELQKYLELKSNHTALSMLKKIKTILISTPPFAKKLKGNVEILTQPFYFPKKKQSLFIVIAVETNNKKIGRVRLLQIKNLHSDEINAFVQKNVETGSLIIKQWWNNQDILKRKGYTYAIKHPEYTYPYARKIFKELQKQIYKYDDLDNIGSLLNEFCISFNCLKEEISFDELLERAINSPPILSKSND